MNQQLSKLHLSVASVIMMIMLGFFVGKAGSVPADDIEEMNYSYGKVFRVSPQEISVTEYDYEKDQEINESYTIDPAIELQNIPSLDRLAAGDEVEIYYDNKNGKKIALIISRPQVEDDQVENDNDEPLESESNISPDKDDMPMNLLEDNAQIKTEQKGEQK